MKCLMSLFFSSLIIGTMLTTSVLANNMPPNFYRCTRDVPLIEALQILHQSSFQETTSQMAERGVKVLFKDMKDLGKAYRNHDALTIVTEDRQQVIFINNKHQSAPPQALAALINHEILHSDEHNSLQEEMVAWHREGQTWQHMLKLYPELQQVPNGTFPLVDRLNAIVVLQNQNRLEDAIQNNMAYKGLPLNSPGF